LEVGGRDVAGGNVSVVRRDRLYREDGKLDSTIFPQADFVAQAAAMLVEIQTGLFAEAKARLDGNITRGVTDFAGIEAAFADGQKTPGWVEIAWSRPTGAALEAVVERLKGLKLTMRNVPLEGGAVDGACPLTGEPAVERILIGRAY
jgi:prolyl-tRNA synthetase